MRPFQAAAGTLNVIDCWVCHSPLEDFDTPFPWTLLSTGNHKSCPPVATLPTQSIYQNSWYLSHLHYCCRHSVILVNKCHWLVMQTNMTSWTYCPQIVPPKIRTSFNYLSWTGESKLNHPIKKLTWRHYSWLTGVRSSFGTSKHL